jgi:hypothetical protein
MHEVSELTGLRELSIQDSYSPEGRLEELLLLLTQLKQLTMLKYAGRHNGYVHHALTGEVRRTAMIDAAGLSIMFHLWLQSIQAMPVSNSFTSAARPDLEPSTKQPLCNETSNT